MILRPCGQVCVSSMKIRRSSAELERVDRVGAVDDDRQRIAAAAWPWTTGCTGDQPHSRREHGGDRDAA